MKRLITILLLMIPHFIYAGGNVEIEVQHITTIDGLPANSIRSIYQDTNGFLWFGTINNGICKYDGKKFTPINAHDPDLPSLADPRISRIIEDKYGHLWVITMSDQVSCYDLRKEAFIDYSGNGNCYTNYGHVDFIDDDIWLWGSTQGCMLVDYENGVFTSDVYSVDSNDLPSDKVTFLMNDPGNDCVWIGTSSGLCKYHDGKIEWTISDLYFVAGERRGNVTFFIAENGQVWKVAGDGIGILADIPELQPKNELISGNFCRNESEWLIYSTVGTFCVNLESGEVTRERGMYDLLRGEVIKDRDGNVMVHDKAGNVLYIDRITEKTVALDLRLDCKHVFWTSRYSFTRTSGGVVWISTHDNGLFMYDLNNDSFQHFKAPDGISSDILMCVMEDRAGNIWVGSEFSGVFKINIINNGAYFMHMTDESVGNEYSDMVRLIHQDESGDVWVCTRDGAMHVFDSMLVRKKSVRHFDANVYAVLEDKELWIGTRGKGLHVGDRIYTHDSNNYSSLSSNNIFSILKDHSGDIWVGTFGGGLDLAVPDGNGGYLFKHYFNDTYSRRHVRTLCQDSNGYIWVGSSNGVIVFDPQVLKANPAEYKSFNSFNGRLRSNESRSIICDSKGRVYIAESGRGFSICCPEDYSNLKFTHYSVEDGLVNGLVQGFVEDMEGRMWITTEYGISCFDPETEKFRNFIFSGNMQSNVNLDNTTERLSDGRLLIGTNSGMAVIDAEESMAPLTEASVAKFTDLTVEGISVNPSVENTPVSTAVCYNPDIILDYDRNSFSLSFSTMDFKAGTRYSYRLDGYDDAWSISNDQNVAVYKDLSPGKYKFEVKACNSDGIWQEIPSSIKIVVKPPFYRTAVAYVLYILMILAVLYFVNRLFIKITRLRNEAKLEKQLTEYKLVFFTNISHEFRTPLTLILHSLEKLKGITDSNPHLGSTIKVMESGANRLLRLINQLLEFRKIQNDKHQMRLQETDLISFCKDIWQNFAESAEAMDIDYVFSSEKEVYMMHVDRGDMDKIIWNLLSNAMKYTPRGGRVELRVTVDEPGKKVAVSVIDNGMGVPKDKRKDIFTRFSHGESSESSMGIGLNLTKALVDANNGEIQYKENPGGGTIMTVKLPSDLDVSYPENICASSSSVKECTSTNLIVSTDYGTRPVKPINPHKILVIEDDKDIRRLIVEELSTHFNVIDAPDGQTGLDLLRSDDSIELVVCDVMMPGMSGYEVTSTIKADFSICHIPVILLTALHSDDRMLEGIQSGADAYITKPFSPNYVLTRIVKLLEQRNKLREKFSNDLSLKSAAICSNDRDREFMDKIDSILEKQLGNPDFSMDDFASELALGRSSFYNKIRSVTGYSPNKYLRIMRMKKAAEYFLSGKYTAAEVAYKVGIQDASYFSKSFKEQFGMSPKAFYKQAIEGQNQDTSQDD